MLLAELVATSSRVGASSGRLEKIEQIASLLRRTAPDEAEIVVAILSGNLRQGRIGIGGALLRDASAPAAAEPSLEIRAVDETFARIARATGSGSAREKGRLLHELMAAATREEQSFLTRLIFGELRQGALEGLMVEAVARAAQLPVALIRRGIDPRRSVTPETGPSAGPMSS